MYLRLQPHRQTSVAHRQNHKLSRRFYGPFRIVARIGLVAYKLDLPSDARIHDVFHVSKLKRCHGEPSTHSIPLLAQFVNDQPLLQPASVLNSRTILVLGRPVPQVLIQWEGQPASDATWEDHIAFHQDFPTFNLEDKVSFQEAANDASDVTQIRRSGRTERVSTQVTRFKDFVM